MNYKTSRLNTRPEAASLGASTNFRLALIAAMLSTTTMSCAAFAQDAGTSAANPSADVAAQEADTGSQLQDIVVTAQRRSENAQNVPISITAFGGDALKIGGVTSALELGHVDPSVKTSFNQGIAFPFIRGIGNIAAGVVGNEPSVAMYVDDFYYTRLYSSILELNSIEKVEVLKGPQGTLFGRNATGGAIQMFTKDPGKDVEINATLGYANYDKYSGQLYVSAPLSDNLAWNVAIGGSDQNDGWGHSVANGQKEYLGHSWTIRSKLVWEPTDTTKIKLVGYYAYQKDDFGQEHDVLKGTVSGTTNLGFLAPNIPAGYPNPVVIYPSLADSGGFYDSRNTYRTDAIFKTYGASLRIDQDAGFADLVSITAFKNSNGYSDNQVSWASPNWFLIRTDNVDNQITQEFQVKSKANSAVNWIIGAFYMHDYAGYPPATFTGDLVNIFIAPGGRQDIYGTQTINSYSVFGQATVPLDESTNITGGLRYTRDELSGEGRISITNPAVGTTVIPATPVNHTFQRVTWKAAIDHHFSRDVMVYASYSRGFKAGTYNTIPIAAKPVNPEVVDAYELGFKSEMFDRRVRLNGALFWSDIKNPQVLTVVGTGFSAAAGLVNAGSARTRGVELGLTAVAAKGLELRASVTYLDAIYTDFANGPHYEGGVPGGLRPTYPILTGASDIGNQAVFPATFDATGYALPDAPKWSFSVGANYSVDAPIGHLVADVGLSYKGQHNWGVSYQYNGLSQKPVTLVNAGINFTPVGLDRVTFGVWGKNIGNVRHYAFSEGNVYGFGASGWRGTAAAPQTYGGTITVKY